MLGDGSAPAPRTRSRRPRGHSPRVPARAHVDPASATRRPDPPAALPRFPATEVQQMPDPFRCPDVRAVGPDVATVNLAGLRPSPAREGRPANSAPPADTQARSA